MSEMQEKNRHDDASGAGRAPATGGKVEAIANMSRQIAAALDRTHINGPLKNDIVGSASQVVTAKATLMGMLLEGSGYDIAMQVYGESFRPNELAIAFEVQLLKLDLGSYMTAAETRGLDVGRIGRVAVAHNGLSMAVGSWGHTGVFGPTSTTNEILEAVNVAKAKAICKELKYSIARDSEGQHGVALAEDGERVLFLPFKELTSQTEAARRFNLDTVPDEHRESMTRMFKGALDAKLAFGICVACHVAEIPGALNARGRLLPFDKPPVEAGVDKAKVGAELSEYYAALRRILTEKKLDTLPPLAEFLGGPAV